MSPLWRSRKIKQLKTKHKRPSPKNIDNSISLAQGNYPFHSLICKSSSIEGISLPIFFYGKISAGMTVEAAVVLPLFLFFFLNLSCAVEIIRLHGNLQLALWEVASRLSVYGYALEQKEQNTLAEELSGIALSYGYIRSEMVKYVGEEYLDASPLTHGAKGLQFLESEVFSEGDYFEINVTYSISPWINLAGFHSFRMANRYYGHFWNGYEIPDAAGQENALDTVYVTENAEVYHADRGCSHLNISVSQVAFRNVDSCRNINGGTYTPCEKCFGKTGGGIVYITEEGNRYHSSRSCSGLKRTVYSVLLVEAQKYDVCKRCGNK